MGYSYGGRIIEFEELSTDEKIAVVLRAVNQLEFTMRELSIKIDVLIEKRPEIEPCPGCGKLEVGVNIINANRTLMFCEWCNPKTSSIVGGSTPQEALVAWNKQSRDLRGLKP